VSRNRTETKLIVIHDSATRRRQDIGVRSLNGWHLERGIYSDRGLSGYHYAVRRSGTVEIGRDLRAIGQHALGYNDVSVGICMIGGVNWDHQPEDNFTADQFEALERIVAFLKHVWPSTVVIPHSMIQNKDCPAFDVHSWYETWASESDERRATELLAGLEQDK
jgi:N-acetylmuramoyl-L-alanine amidase